MLKLYRGIVDNLTYKGEGLISSMCNHIRSFNDGETDGNNFGVRGFWNILLEATFTLYIQMFVVAGILLTIGLAIVFFPLHALCMVTLNILNHRAEPFHQEYNEPTVEKKDVA